MTSTATATFAPVITRLPSDSHVRVTTRTGGAISGRLASWEGPTYPLFLFIDAAPELGWPDSGGRYLSISGDSVAEVFEIVWAA